MRAAVLMLLVWLLAVGARADAVHFNQIEVRKVSPTTLTLEYRISDYEIWRTLLAPGKTEQEFFTQISGDTPGAFEKRLAQGIGQLVGQARVELASARVAKIQRIDMPKGADARELLQQSVLLKGLPSNMQPHLAPLVVLVHLKSPEPLQRIQVSAPRLLHPVLVVYGADRFWLTAQVDKSLLDL